MNNSKFLIDSLEPPEIPDKTEVLQRMEQRAVRILEALGEVIKSEAWSSLKELLFEDLTKKLEEELLREAKRPESDDRVLSRLSGQLLWAERYSNLDKLYDETRLELQRIRTLLYGNKQSGESE